MTYRHTHSTKEIGMFRECPRKWAAKYLFRHDDPKHPNAQKGIDVHQLLERMLKDGPQVNVQPESEIGALARALYPLAPAGAHAEVGSKFELAGMQASFKLDWVAPGFEGFGDFKTCAGERWALAPRNASPEKQQAALAGDLQANLEAFGFMTLTARTHVPLRWCYVDKKTLKAWTVDAVLTLAGAQEWLEATAVPTMRLIEQLRTAWFEGGWRPTLDQIPHELTACGGSGHMCSFLGQCQFKPASITTERLYQLSR